MKKILFILIVISFLFFGCTETNQIKNNSELDSNITTIIKNQRETDDDLFLQAIKDNNVVICQNIVSPSIKDNCYLNLAIKNNSVDLCNKHSNFDYCEKSVLRK